MSKTAIIGLTGNIATGKSTVIAMLAMRGACCIDADRVVHYLLDNNQVVQGRIEDRFGASIRRPDGAVDRSVLGAIVFQHPAALLDLEAIIHPLVGEHVDALIARCGDHVAVIEAIKLLESELCQRCQSIWVTTCPEELQVERLMSGRGMTQSEAVARIRSQPAQSEKLAQADVIIDTGCSLAETEQQVALAWADFVSHYTRRRHDR